MVCPFPDCGRPIYSNGLCQAHRRQQLRGKPLSPLKPKPPTYAPICSVEDCERAHHSRGYCASHYHQLWRGEELRDFDRSKPSLVRNESGHKQCTQCFEWQDVSKYSKNSAASDGYRGICKLCVYSRDVSRIYNVSRSWLRDTMKAQNGCCPICKKEPSKWAVDHDHSCCPGEGSCGECVRGLICSQCNVLLGFAGDSPTVLESASQYLRETTKAAV